MTTSREKIKVCPQCAANFACSPTDCWCSKLPPVMPMVENAACYCPACLSTIIEQKRDTANVVSV